MNLVPDLSIVIPCYNEAGNIPLIINRFREILPSSYSVEILLVNNGSTDDSESVFKKELAVVNDSRFKVVNVIKNQGYGFGILSGMQAASAPVLAWTHADMQTDPKDVLSSYDLFLKSNSTLTFVKGSRKQRSLVPLFFTWGMGVIASLALRARLTDVGAQPKLFSREFYLEYIKDKAPFDFSLDLYAQYWAYKKGNILEVPVYFSKRLHGDAKGGGSIKTRIKITMRVIRFIFHTRTQLKKAGQL